MSADLDTLTKPLTPVTVPLSALAAVPARLTRPQALSYAQALLYRGERLKPIVIGAKSRALLDGHHRLTAARRAGAATIDVIWQ